MVVESFYLTNKSSLDKTIRLLPDLTTDELEAIVGRFKHDHHRWPNALKGEVVIDVSKTGVTTVIIRHHFTKQPLLKQEVGEDLYYHEAY